QHRQPRPALAPEPVLEDRVRHAIRTFSSFRACPRRLRTCAASRIQAVRLKITTPSPALTVSSANPPQAGTCDTASAITPAAAAVRAKSASGKGRARAVRPSTADATAPRAKLARVAQTAPSTP